MAKDQAEQTEPQAAVSMEERLAVAEERLAAAMEMIAAQGAQTAEVLAQAQSGRQDGAAAGKWASLDAAEAAQALQGTVSDALETDTLLSELDPPQRPITFISKGANFKAIRIGRQRTTAPNGEVIVSTGVTYDFAPTGTYTAKTVEAVTFLRSRQSMNVEFWEVGKEPHAAPDTEKIMQQILDALGDYDDEALRQIEEIEQASHKREVVLKAVAHARKVVQGVAAPEPVA